MGKYYEIILKGISPTAIIVSLVVGFAGGAAVTTIYTYSWILLSELKLIATRQPAFIGWTLIGLGFTFLSGMLCAHLAKREKIKNALMLGIVMTLYLVYFLLRHPETLSDWMRITALVTYIPLTYAGGKMYVSLSKKNT